MTPEQALISAVLRSRSYAAAIGYELTPDMFEEYSDEWSWLLNYMNKYRRVPPKASFLQAFDQFRIAKVDDADHQAELVRKRYVERSLKENVTAIYEKLRNGQLDEALADMQGSVIAAATQMGTVPDSDVMRGADDVISDVEEYHDRVVETGFAGIPTGFKSWDTNTGGVKPGEFVVVGARLGHGKSWVLAKMAAEAVMQGYTALYDSLEMTRTNITLRVQTLLSSAVGRPYAAADLMAGTTVPDLQGYREVVAHLAETVPGSLHVADQTRGRISPTTIAAQIERIQPDVVFIDYLTLLHMSGDGDWQSVANLSNTMKQMAQRYKIPIVAAAQLNRANGLTKGVPNSEAMARSDSIGQDADQIMNLQARSKRVMAQKLVKNRNGVGGFSWFSEFRPGAGVLEEINSERAYELIDEDGEVDDD